MDYKELEERRIASLLSPEVFSRQVAPRAKCAICGGALIYWCDGRWIHENRTADHMAVPTE